jgi:type II secretion system protein J
MNGSVPDRLRMRYFVSSARKRCSGSYVRGFSLIELLLAISILASISVFAITMLGTQMENRNDIVRHNESQHVLHAAMTRIYEDLRHAYLPTQKDAIMGNASRRKVPPVLRQRSDSFYFTFQANRSFVRNTPVSNLGVVRYYTRKDPDNSRLTQLVRSLDTDMEENIEKSETSIDFVLVPDLKEFKVTWWDGSDFRSEWDTDQSDTRGYLPKMAKIELSIYMELTNEEKVKLEEGSLSSDQRTVLSADSVVYLLYSKPFEQIKPKSSDYSWR